MGSFRRKHSFIFGGYSIYWSGWMENGRGTRDGWWIAEHSGRPVGDEFTQWVYDVPVGQYLAVSAFPPHPVEHVFWGDEPCFRLSGEYPEDRNYYQQVNESQASRNKMKFLALEVLLQEIRARAERVKEANSAPSTIEPSDGESNA